MIYLGAISSGLLPMGLIPTSRAKSNIRKWYESITERRTEE
jgi:hypothetical protein